MAKKAKKIKIKSLMTRSDNQVIAQLIDPGSRVLDLGCGNGTLLDYLRKEKNVKGMGVELYQDKIIECASVGIPVVQCDLNTGLKDFSDNAFDAVILSQTLQQIFEPARLLYSLARIGKRVIVSFPNFSQYTIRMQLLLDGVAPKNDQLPYHWYDTPNIHLLTINDFSCWCERNGIRIVSGHVLREGGVRPAGEADDNLKDEV